MNQIEQTLQNYGTLNEKMARLARIDAVGYAYLHRR